MGKAAFHLKWPCGSPYLYLNLQEASGGSAETRRGMQIDYDLARVRNKGNVNVRRVARVG